MQYMLKLQQSTGDSKLIREEDVFILDATFVM